LNCDATEVNKFSALAPRWWDRNGPCAPLHILNKCRVQFIQRHTDLANKTVLDVGCGAGILTESLAMLNANICGLDASDAVIQEATAHATTQGLNITYYSATIETLAETHNSKFDVITCMELLEHVPNPDKLIFDCMQLLKPGGKLFLSTLNRTLRSYALAIIGAEYLFNILPKQTHDYKKFISPAELNSMLQATNMRLMALDGVKYNPFTKSASFTSDLSVNYLAFATKEI
jgi:2-polyprenyl-6-hydroxyphenyl methylase/3-demethylubiquinone-9 3-methyltransferase